MQEGSHFIKSSSQRPFNAAMLMYSSSNGSPRLYLLFVLNKILYKFSFSTICFWDIRPQKTTTTSQPTEKKKEESIEIPYDVPSSFLHLNLSWKPFSRVRSIELVPAYLLTCIVFCINTHGCTCPLKVKQFKLKQLFLNIFTSM
jgi:hypothetical protein